MKVKVFPVNGMYTVCAELEDGSMDPNYCSIPDLEHSGTAHYITDRINEAYRAGKRAKAKEIRQALEV